MRRQNVRSYGIRIGATLLAALPARAEAHSNVQGLSDFASGALHPLLTPLHFLILLGLGLWIGQSVPLRLKIPVLAFVPSAAAGLLGTLTGRFSFLPPPFLLALSLCFGGLVALDLRLPGWAAAILIGLTGFAMGLDSVADHATTAWAMAKTLVGTWFGLFIVLVNIAFYTSQRPPKQWVHTAIRVAGSWIVAISLLMLAFSLKK